MAGLRGTTLSSARGYCDRPVLLPLLLGVSHYPAQQPGRDDQDPYRGRCPFCVQELVEVNEAEDATDEEEPHDCGREDKISAYGPYVPKMRVGKRKRRHRETAGEEDFRQRGRSESE